MYGRFTFVAFDCEGCGSQLTADDGESFCAACEDAADSLGSCAWGGGATGRIGTVHVAKSPDGDMEECCTFA